MHRRSLAQKYRFFSNFERFRWQPHSSSRCCVDQSSRGRIHLNTQQTKVQHYFCIVMILGLCWVPNKYRNSWNSLPESVQQSTSLHSFEAKLFNRTRFLIGFVFCRLIIILCFIFELVSTFYHVTSCCAQHDNVFSKHCYNTFTWCHWILKKKQYKQIAVTGC